MIKKESKEEKKDGKNRAKVSEREAFRPVLEHLKKPMGTLSVVELIDSIVQAAFETHASDVHIHPEEEGVRLRFRIEGDLEDAIAPAGINKELHQEVISRIKVMAGLRTDEHSTPQDGRFRVYIKKLGQVDVRVSIMPTYYGENAVLRVLAEMKDFTLETIGLASGNLLKVQRAIEKPYGMILANGPTSSGKTTTLYTLLKEINKPTRSIITIEDPIEYSLDGTTQIQVNAKTGLTFAAGLRSILRQDPNVVMVGEIRDSETAGIAVNAALTGHLVLSTLHTNDAATTFPRLIDMGVPPFLVASTLNIAMGQRLVRQLCDECKTKRRLTDKERISLAEIVPDATREDIEVFAPGGCDACHGDGYRGRIGIREVLEVNDEIRKLIMDRANASIIKEVAVRSGMKTMLQDGFQKAQEGETSLKEVLKIIHE